MVSQVQYLSSLSATWANFTNYFQIPTRLENQLHMISWLSSILLVFDKRVFSSQNRRCARRTTQRDCLILIHRPRVSSSGPLDPVIALQQELSNIKKRSLASWLFGSYPIMLQGLACSSKGRHELAYHIRVFVSRGALRPNKKSLGNRRISTLISAHENSLYLWGYMMAFTLAARFSLFLNLERIWFWTIPDDFRSELSEDIFG